MKHKSVYVFAFEKQVNQGRVVSAIQQYISLCIMLPTFLLSPPPKWFRKKNQIVMARGSSPESRGRRVRIFLVYCIVLLCICVVSCPYVIYYPTVMTRYSLFVLKVPLNPNQANKQTIIIKSITVLILTVVKYWIY